MNKRITIMVISCFVCSLAIIALLFALSDEMKITKGSFLREFPPHPVAEVDTLDIGFHSYYIAGGSPHKLYLGNYTNPLRVLIADITSGDTQKILLEVAGIYEQKFWSPRVLVDSPNFYLVDGTVPVIYRGNVNDWTGEKYLFDSIYFQHFVSIHEGAFAVKSLSGSTRENILGKLTEWEPYQIFTESILQKQQDGVFCTDGMLCYNRKLRQLVYTYYYRNEFIVMDTSLNLLYRGNTIDTTSVARIKTSAIESENWKTLSSPQNIVNNQIDVSDNWLFVHSNLLARNEHPQRVTQSSVVDMYNLKNGKYIFSFYLYHFAGKTKMNEFRVFGETLVVRFDHILLIYRLKPEYFKRLSEPL